MWCSTARRRRCGTPSPGAESNRGPLPYHGSALPTELPGRTSAQRSPAEVRRRTGAPVVGRCRVLVEGAGFEPAKAKPSGLQPDPFGHSGIPPGPNPQARGAQRTHPGPTAANGSPVPSPSPRPAPRPADDLKESPMAESSFDIEAGVDRQEVDNAINQAAREVATRFDFRDTDSVIAWAGEESIQVESASEDRARAALEVLRDKC